MNKVKSNNHNIKGETNNHTNKAERSIRALYSHMKVGAVQKLHEEGQDQQPQRSINS